MRKVTSRPPNVDGRQMTAVGIIKGQTSGGECLGLQLLKLFLGNRAAV
jgi:hypothetical protein